MFPLTFAGVCVCVCAYGGDWCGWWREAEIYSACTKNVHFEGGVA